jgi:hypothetical protein
MALYVCKVDSQALCGQPIDLIEHCLRGLNFWAESPAQQRYATIDYSKA